MIANFLLPLEVETLAEERQVGAEGDWRNAAIYDEAPVLSEAVDGGERTVCFTEEAAIVFCSMAVVER